jgi:hypothetical protein
MVKKESKKPLYDIILIPEIFKVGEKRSDERDVFDLFKTLKYNSIILIDKDNKYLNLIQEYINSCSPKFKDPLLRHFKQLKIQKRLINFFNTSEEETAEKSIFDYDYYYSQLKDHNYDFVFVNDYCKESCLDKFGMSNMISISDLLVDPTIEQCFENTGKFEVEDKSDKESFENCILIPTIKYAKHIKLIDRYIGRHFHEDRKTPEQLASLKEVDHVLSEDRYFKSIVWILEVIKNNSQYQLDTSQTNDNSKYPSVEIITGLQTDLINDLQKEAIVEFFQTVSEKFREIYRYDIRIYLKDEGASTKMPHERLFVTDQIIVQFDRGFTLLKQNNTMMGTILNVLDSYDEQEIRTIDDLI